VTPVSAETVADSIGKIPPSVPDSVSPASSAGSPTLEDERNPSPPMVSQAMLWLLAGAVIVGGTFVYFGRTALSTNGIVVCPVPSARQLAADLVQSYASHSGMPANRFVLRDANTCDVRFSTTAETPDAVIAHDAIVAIVNPLNPISHLSETQLRGIFSGTILDWSQLGGPHLPIVPILPDASSDEANIIATSLFFGAAMDRGVRRGGSSADIRRAVAGPGPTSRRTIGLIAFSQAVGVKVVPLSDLPAPSAVSIASGRYPYWWAIAVESDSSRSAGAAAGLVDYARSREGAAIVRKDRLVSPKAR
jgi:hypothetical protein